MFRASLCFLLASTFLAAAAASAELPEDRGAAGLHQALQRLKTSARVLYITAHPDDEDGGAITYLTRGLGASVTLLSLTRGESGANLITGDFFDSLGALRTLELLRAAQYYGCRLRFTSHIDYGYSKNVEEAWRNWDREKLLGEVVRIVREEKPHVILARWQGNARDGHGHHSAAGVMAQLAFDAAADPARFPEQLRGGGLSAWSALKLYSDNRRENDEWTIRLDSGRFDPVLGRSYAQIARDGLRWQRSQGAGAVVSRPGPQVTYYHLLKSRLAARPAKESSFFEGIEGLAKPGATTPSEIARGLAAARAAGAGAREIERWSQALHLALGVELEALVQPEKPVTGPMSMFRPYETFGVATPGQTFDVALTFHARQSPGELKPARFELAASEPGWTIREKSPGLFSVTVPNSAQATRAYWRRDSVQALSYTIDDASRFGRPLPPAPLVARVHYEFEGAPVTIEREPQVSTIDTLGVQQLRPLAVGPALSLRFTTDAGVLPASRARYGLRVVVRNISNQPRTAAVSLNLPAGWRSEPPQAEVKFEKENEESVLGFEVVAPAGDARGGDVAVEAVARSEGREYRTAFLPHTFTGLDTLYLERPARHAIRRVNVTTASGLRVGYIAGTGDDVPQTLGQLGVSYELIDTAQLATGDLARYSTILLGIRAYAARNDVKTYNQRLLDYVAQGGVLIVQYNTPEYDNNYGPAPYSMGRNPEEVSEENSPVTILDPADPVFTSPNRITAADFDGWVEQRGSKFFATWDARWKPLLETHDTGQAPQKGGWLVARHGKGLYVYCAYAWYRQLPFAVPGAVRLFANLISLPATAR